MLLQPIKFYQTGTFTIGNRLLAEGQRSVQANMRRTNSLNSGHRACQGCGEALGARYAIDAAMQASGNRVMAVNATGCLEVFSTPYPETSWQIPWMHSLFGNAAAVAAGVAAAMRVKGRGDVKVIAQGGDGGTMDIGFGCLSGIVLKGYTVIAGQLESVSFLDLDSAAVDRVLAREREVRRSGPIAEAVLRGMGAPGARIG